jgi:VWFA-related protein
VRRSQTTLAGALGVVTLGLASWPSAHPRAFLALDGQQPVFRAAVDLVAVDVQVVDANGDPTRGLGPERFEVTIGGRRRRVVSAELISTGGDSSRSDAARNEGRLITLAIDHSSFEAGAARAAMEAAQRFVDRLSPDDRLGLYVYPNGPRIEPTQDRASIRTNLHTILGTRQSLRSQYNLKPSDVVDITAQAGIGGTRGQAARGPAALQDLSNTSTDPIATVQLRECPGDLDCAARIFSEALAVALHLESQAAISLGGLDRVLRELGQLPGRKSVVLISAGVVVSDRPGGRPDVGDAAHVMGQMAARANVSVYTIHIDPGLVGAYSASRRRADGRERDRDRQMLGQWLEQFSDGAGGMLIDVPVGGGDFAFERVLRETSAYYLLGVEPADADRDGRARPLRVRVPGNRLTVRSRQWVIVPDRRTN